MRNAVIIAIFAGLLGYGAMIYLQPYDQPSINVVSERQNIVETGWPKELPHFSFETIEGINYQTRDLNGKILVINFWASWCTPCKKEFPALLELATLYHDKLLLIAVSSDLTIEPIEKFIADLRKQGHDTAEANVLITHDENTEITSGLFGITGLPETLITDRSHNIKYRLIGADWDFIVVRDLLDELE